MQAYLKKHGASFAAHSIRINWERQERRILIDFQVQKRLSGEWLADSLFTQDWSKNWGLWNKDVIEAFLQLRKSPDDSLAPYLEIQVSPLNQPFALIITEPRKTFFPPAKLSLSTTSTTDKKLWSGRMEVELPMELNGSFLYGGFFSCLGSDPKEYYALQPNSESSPDFHRPDLFMGLDS